MKKTQQLLFAVLVWCFSSMALTHAQNAVLQQPGDALVYNAGGMGRLAMNGYALSDFGDFTKNWHFVSTTFRKDTDQVHFAYANDLAWQTISSGATDYPDGAMFGKVAFAAGGNPVFADSWRPQRQDGYQVMVRDNRRFADTGGWGYMAYSPGGVVIGTNDTAESEACHACHKLVKQRGSLLSGN